MQDVLTASGGEAFFLLLLLLRRRRRWYTDSISLSNNHYSQVFNKTCWRKQYECEKDKTDRQTERAKMKNDELQGRLHHRESTDISYVSFLMSHWISTQQGQKNCNWFESFVIFFSSSFLDTVDIQLWWQFTKEGMSHSLFIGQRKAITISWQNKWKDIIIKWPNSFASKRKNLYIQLSERALLHSMKE